MEFPISVVVNTFNELLCVITSLKKKQTVTKCNCGEPFIYKDEIFKKIISGGNIFKITYIPLN